MCNPFSSFEKFNHLFQPIFYVLSFLDWIANFIYVCSSALANEIKTTTTPRPRNDNDDPEDHECPYKDDTDCMLSVQEE